MTVRSYQSDDRLWVAESNVQFYRRFHDFDVTFSEAVNAALDLLEDQMSKATSNYLIAEAANRPVGCIFLSAETPTVGRIRLFFVEDAYRGKGIGARLLGDGLSRARRNGLQCIRVSTFDQHPEACRLYESFGFERVNSAEMRAYGRDMHQRDYELLLGGGDA
ncbi:GNAT family N-acetyltransferase [Tropicimonas sp. TH_r6]|uniref:GNAT family N-acetyltransferase n=1 Tax=Tropicimonas sp. TH_r6 TaxID=3082085 RepID=UPI00295438DA|nr:GNAT family N-acetyltransferase [Tropicimonas sp. TH_r6]MDV7143776.1 GNAT family N-acetyltransferase [Tropicimonas sp. TH_r6]